MRRSKKRKENFGGIKLLKLIGKPIYLLCTIFIVFVYAIVSLFTIYTQQLRTPRKSSRTRKRGGKPRADAHKYRAFAFQLPRWIKSGFFISFFTTLLVGTSMCVGIYQYILRDLPDPTILKDHPPALSTKIYDRNHVLLYQMYRDENRSLIKLNDLPPYVIQATLASEDKDFYHHHGIDLRGIMRAALANAKRYYSCYVIHTSCFTSLQGGSTITQQLIKNALLSPEQTWTRKVKELVLSMWTERLYTKAEILEMYFNYVPYGGTAYGIEEAAHQYFGKSARDMTLAEATLLAGLPVAPTSLSPFGTHPYLAKNRQSQVIDAMIEEGYITDSVGLAAKSASLTFKPQGISIQAPHFIMYVKDLLVQKYGEDMVSRGGLDVTTTLDLSDQKILDQEMNAELSKLKSLHVDNAAGLITKPGTGEILAMVGSHNFFDTTHDGQVNVTLQPRQPGSSIKPITYTLAFMSGLTPNSTIEDAPVCFTSVGSPNYCPRNYDGRYHGTVTARTALASSYNIPAIKLLNSLGVMNMVNLARQMGITTWDDPSRFGLSLTLGGGEVTMLDMAEVYGIFANDGTKVPLTSIVSVKNQYGKEMWVPQAQEGEVIPPSIAYQISTILSDPLARAPAFGTHSVLNIPGFPVAVKTGTTNNLRDNWTFGYTPDILVATWVGNNDNSPMSSVASGITGASPIWSRTMQKLLAGTTPHPFSPPGQMVAVAVCPTTGAAYCSNLCGSQSRTEYFVPGTEPKKNCADTGTLLGGAAQTTKQ